MFNIFKKKKGRPVLVIGLDCAEPSFVFEQWRDDLPTLGRLRQTGAYGRLTSCIPCITVPAWSSMLSGQDPGELGIYGFRNRVDYSYERMATATGAAVKVKRVWDYLNEAGKQSILVGVPQTYPVQPLNGCLISDFLTPTTQKQYTHPHELRYEISRLLDGRDYDVDVPNFRTENKADLLRQIYEMTEKRFKVLNYLIREKPWDFFMVVEMGVDRIHHGLWKYHDPQHCQFEPGNPYQNAIKEYYQYIDQQLAGLLSAVNNDALILVVSDHGAKRMDGGFCLNQWLHREGYLVFKRDVPATGLTPFEQMEVDWTRTTAWGSGGYYGRLWLNVQGREPQGIVAPADFERVRAEIVRRLESLPDHTGRPLGTTCYRPEAIYRRAKGIPPDLIIYFGNLHWRSVGSLGHPDVYTFENDTGPDDANHAQEGLFIYHDPRQNLRGQPLEGLQLMDIAPTILQQMGLPVPAEMQGKVISVDN